MSTLTRLHRWAVRFGAFWMAKWGERSFLILLAILIGGLAAVAAGVLHLMVEWLTRGSTALVGTLHRSICCGAAQHTSYAAGRVSRFPQMVCHER